MCRCGKAVINGEFGYRWDDETTGIYPVNAPELSEGDNLLYDEPGRCGGLDSHSYHYRVVQNHGILFLLVRHGAGDQRIRLSGATTLAISLSMLTSTARYWILNALYHAQSEASRNASDREAQKWQKFAAEKRIKTRRTKNGVRVWIADAA